MTANLDLSKPSYPAAHAIAGKLAATGDTKGACAMLARLLWLTEGDQGGFLGLHDDALEARARRYGLTMETVTDAQYAQGAWPSVETSIQLAAE